MDQKLALVFAEVTSKSLSVTEVCEQLRISRQTYYKYRRRYAAEGVAGLVERSRRPHSSPRATSQALVEAILATRVQLEDEGWDNGAQSIYFRLVHDGIEPPSWRTIHRVLRRSKVVRDQPRKRPRSSYRRFEFPATNDCWQIDAYETTLANGLKVVIFEVLDDHSRCMVANLAWPSEDTQGAWAVVASAIDRYGTPRMLLSDNDTAFTGKHFGFQVLFERNLAKLGIRLINSRPYHPQTNGKNERAHQTSQRWLAKRPAPKTLVELQSLLDDYRCKYNQRPHQALGGDCPDQRRVGGMRQRPFAGLETAEPSTRAVTKFANRHGHINVATARIALGAKYAGTMVTAFVTGPHVIVFSGHQIVRELTLDPNRRHHGLRFNALTRPKRNVPLPETVSAMS